jgi:CDGSH-type Zn-finger protein
MSVKITAVNDGPLRVEGDFVIVDQTGAAFGLAGRQSISLCRCGHSENKPFCDGQHKRLGFTHTVTACELPPPVKK